MFDQVVHHWLPRLAALLAGSMVAYAGLHFIALAGNMPGIELVPEGPAGMTNLRVVGAFHLGLGMLAIVGAVLRRWTRVALAATLAVGFLIVLVRAYGLAVDGATDLNRTICLREVAFWVVALIGFVLAR